MTFYSSNDAWLFPVFLFAPTAWMVVSRLLHYLAFSEWRTNGFSIGVIRGLLILCLVNWRYVRAKKRLV